MIDRKIVEMSVPLLLARLCQLGALGDDNALIFRNRAPKRSALHGVTGKAHAWLQDRSFGAGCFGNFRCS